METVEIRKIEILSSKKLIIQPQPDLKNFFPYIYRAGAEVEWNATLECFSSPVPREWSYFDWFRHIVGIVLDELEIKLIITERTEWINMENSLRLEIMTHVEAVNDQSVTKEFEKTIWEFIRKDLPGAEFEQWVYSHPELESYWGNNTYLEVISSGFVQEKHLFEIRTLLHEWLEANTSQDCDCMKWENSQVLDHLDLPDFLYVKDYLAAKFKNLKKRNNWSELFVCLICHQKWFVAIGEEWYDHKALRLSEQQAEKIINDDQWPTDFDDLNPCQENDYPPMNKDQKTYKSTLQRLRVPLGFLTAILFLIFSQPSWQTILIGAPIAFCGVAIRAWASGHLRKNAELAVSGPYGYTRNPLYFGSLILAFGIVICGGSWWLGILLLGFFFAVYLPVMQAEAAHMHVLFPADFPDYEQNVPLLFPRFTAWKKDGMRFDQNLYLKYREYRAMIGVAIVMGILVIKVLWF